MNMRCKITVIILLPCLLVVGLSYAQEIKYDISPGRTFVYEYIEMGYAGPDITELEFRGHKIELLVRISFEGDGVVKISGTQFRPAPGAITHEDLTLYEGSTLTYRAEIDEHGRLENISEPELDFVVDENAADDLDIDEDETRKMLTALIPYFLCRAAELALPELPKAERRPGQSWFREKRDWGGVYQSATDRGYPFELFILAEHQDDETFSIHAGPLDDWRKGKLQREDFVPGAPDWRVRYFSQINFNLTKKAVDSANLKYETDVNRLGGTVGRILFEINLIAGE